MDEISILRKSNEILQQQNTDLAESLQHWKSEYFRLEVEKINLLRENIIYKQQVLRWKNVESSLKHSIVQNISDILSSTSQIKQAIDALEDNQDLPSKKMSPLPTKSPSVSNASNVHHVHPMIQGVTIKKPIVRISRTCLNNLAKTSSQPLVADAPGNIVGALVEDDRSAVIDDDDVPVVAQITNSPRKLLDLYVPLSRMDIRQLVVSRNVDECVENNPSQVTSEDISSESQGTDSQNSGYSEDQEGSANLISGDPYDYKSRLDRISEEPEDSGVNWINSRKKQSLLNANNSIEVAANAPTTPRTPIKTSRSTADDPLEGTSWHFNNEHVNVRPKFKSVTKDINSEILVDNENSMEGSQMPDSTTNVVSCRESQEQDQSFVKTFPSVMEFQSTPVEKNELCCTKPPERECSNEYPIEVKVVLSKIGSGVSHSVSCNTICKRVKRKNKSSTESDTTPKRKKNKKKSSVEDSSIMSLAPDDNVLEPPATRPRRGITKDYKEKSLNKKLRRSK